MGAGLQAQLPSWHPTPVAAEKARHAPASSVPVSYMQGQHLRNYCDLTAAGLNFSRQSSLAVTRRASVNIAAMDVALNAYLRRHDTFRSWFEHTSDDQFVRHTITDPADIESSRSITGNMTEDEVRAHVVGIPNPLEWGCFTFGIVQREGHFTFLSPWTTCTATRR